jgi:hypothetical protein
MTTCEVWFYHLERQGLDQVLPTLLERTLQKGWKALVRAPSGDRVEHLDAWLWSYRDDSFLPHAAGAQAGEADPVALVADDAARLQTALSTSPHPGAVAASQPTFFAMSRPSFSTASFAPFSTFAIALIFSPRSRTVLAIVSSFAPARSPARSTPRR